MAKAKGLEEEKETLFKPSPEASKEGETAFDEQWKRRLKRMLLTNIPALGIIMAIIDPMISFSLWVLVLFLLVLNLVILPISLIAARIGHVLKYVPASQFRIGPDGIRSREFTLTSEESPKIGIRPVVNGLAFVIDTSKGGSGDAGNAASTLIVLGLNEADIRDIRKALHNAGFRSSVEMGLDQKVWTSDKDRGPKIMDLHFTIFLGALAVAIYILFQIAGLLGSNDPIPPPYVAINLAGIFLILIVGVIHIPDRISLWRGKRIAGDLKDPVTLEASCQIHWGNAIAMDVMDEAGLLYERKTDTTYGMVDPHKVIHLAGMNEPRISIIVRENSSGGITFYLGSTSRSVDEKGRRLMISMKKDIQGCLDRLEESVTRRHKGEMIDFR
jgi:hypothetical protein